MRFLLSILLLSSSVGICGPTVRLYPVQDFAYDSQGRLYILQEGVLMPYPEQGVQTVSLVRRYDQNGQPDESYGSKGIGWVATNKGQGNLVDALAVDSKDRVVVAGMVRGGQVRNSLRAEFGAGSIFAELTLSDDEPDLRPKKKKPSQKLILPDRPASHEMSSLLLTRLLPDGSRDPSFNEAKLKFYPFSDYAEDQSAKIAVDAENRINVFTQMGDIRPWDLFAARFLESGKVDPGYAEDRGWTVNLQKLGAAPLPFSNDLKAFPLSNGNVELVWPVARKNNQNEGLPFATYEFDPTSKRLTDSSERDISLRGSRLSAQLLVSPDRLFAYAFEPAGKGKLAVSRYLRPEMKKDKNFAAEVAVAGKRKRLFRIEGDRIVSVRQVSGGRMEVTEIPTRGGSPSTRTLSWEKRSDLKAFCRKEFAKLAEAAM